jgi:opacity protein-like surface antigen
MRRLVGLALAVACALAASAPSVASAYRPFDGTDADVADRGAFELELGPAQWYYRHGQGPLRGNYLIAPATVLNLGVFENTEIVVDFQDFVALGPSAPALAGQAGRPAVALLDTDILVKHVFREGSLQGKSGVAFAVEAGPLLPEINGEAGFGASLNAVLSYRWKGGTVHFNEWPSYTRDHNFDIFSGVIVEGPYEWTVRPVCEVFYEKEVNELDTESVLVGAIWNARESLALDVGVRGARVGSDRVAEVRLGFTWALPMWGGGEAPALRAAR